MNDTAANPTPTLYEQLGQREGITAVTHRLYDLIGQDPSVSRYFTDTGMPVQSMIEFLVTASGGPADPTYRMPDLADVHKLHNISGDAFAAVGNHLSQAMTEAGVAREPHDTVINLVVSVRDQVVADSQL